MNIHSRLLRGLASLLLAVGLGATCAAVLNAEASPSPMPQQRVDQAVTSAPSGGPVKPWVAPDVLRQLAEPKASPFRVVAVLRSAADVSPASLDSGLDRAAARARYVQAKQAAFGEALAPLSAVLREAEKRGVLVAQRNLWLINGVAMTAEPSFIRDLMASPDVAEIHLDHYRDYVLEPDHGYDAQSDSDAPVASADTAALVEEAAVVTLPWGVERIRAPQVWANLEITGTGAVVAIFDTGVDWMHPDLLGAYRGNLGKGFFDHSASWYDAVNEGIYPYDDHGHGTHVAGTAVGAQTGVAPGAKWIGVKVLSSDGYGYDSWILSGFQWLLAPGGNPALAPDVVNASWSSSNGYTTVFLSAIQALEAAGIFPVFAAGNSGPTVGSVGSPASNLGVFSVGASDADEDVAVFSGRGPSPWGEVKPAVVAPGVAVVSTVPGGVYAPRNGTSMATPHVAGLMALMRAVSPTVSVKAMASLITGTAQSLTTTVPNNDSGWGRVDAYVALTTLTHPALVTGTVRSVQGTGLAGARVSMQAVTSGTPGPILETTTDAQGFYFIALSPGLYTAQADAFGYVSEFIPRVDVLPDSHSQVDFVLTVEPTGTVRGRVLIAATGEPVTSSVVVRALNTPVSVGPDVEGDYTLALPVGSYTLEARSLGYRVATGTVTVVADQAVVLDFALEDAPELLLVDEGAWYYGSQIPYWRGALDDLGYVYDLLTIKVPGTDTPISPTLESYDIVLWSSPSGSPGLVRAGQTLWDYMDGGGRLLLSGQDVAYFDGGGLSFFGYLEPYLLDKMGAQFVTEGRAEPSVVGRGPFSGMAFSLGGDGGADNQISPDAVAVRHTEHASSVWLYDDGLVAGVAADICVAHRSLFFGFGYEAIPTLVQRREVMENSIDWLMTEPLTAGLTLANVTDPVLIGRPGELVTHVIQVYHIGYAGVTETVDIAIQGNTWPVSLTVDKIDLSPCAFALITATVTIPAGAGVNTTDQLTLAVSSATVPTPVTLSVSSKTPAPVLLVDDDRWYPVEALYTEGLAAAHIPFDIWDTRSAKGGTPTAYSPPTDTLSMYPVVVWFTGYDWYAPVVPEEADRILAYLDQGGRLLLSSQDFVYHHEDEPLTDRLGILFPDWADKAELAAGVAEHPAGGDWGPEGLVYPFPNWSHTVEPSPETAVVVRGQLGQPLGLAAGSPVSGASQTLFYAVPLEALPPASRAQALANGVGWLSPLGATDWHVTPTSISSGGTVTFSLVLRNSWREPLDTDAVHQIPDEFAISTESLPPMMEHDPGLRQLSWSGSIQPDVPVTLTWAATWTGGVGPATKPTVTLSLPGWSLSFVREAAFYGNGPDLAGSGWSIPGEGSVRIGVPVSLTFMLENQSLTEVASGTLSLWFMEGVTPITSMVPMTRGLSTTAWAGSLLPYEQHTLTVPVRGWTWDHPVRLDALLEDGTGGRWERSLWLNVSPWRSYLPAVMRDR